MAKSKSKARTNGNTLSKRVAVPVWAILMFVLLVLGTGIWIVYQSYAYRSNHDIAFWGDMKSIYCSSGKCYFTGGPGHGTARQEYVYPSDGCASGYAHRPERELGARRAFKVADLCMIDAPRDEEPVRYDRPDGR